MAPRTLLTLATRDLLWANVEDQKGDNSIWLRDFGKAYSAICAVDTRERMELLELQNANQATAVMDTPRSEAPQPAKPMMIDTHSLQRLNTFLLEPSPLLLPKDDGLKKLHRETVSKISTVVDKILGPVKDNILSIFLRSTVTRTPKETRYNPISISTVSYQTCPEVYKHLVSRSKQLMMDQNFEYRKTAANFASYTHSVLKGFLTDNFWNMDAVAHTQLSEGLESVFISALKLKAQTSLDPTRFRSEWPRRDQVYDPTTTINDNADNPGKSTDTVRLALFPTLIRIEQGIHDGLTTEQDAAETYIARGRVLLQRPED
ncbi:MAG: hypothetical protein Q9169_001401 [Polycauliona sp. 2 TL-2023]